MSYVNNVILTFSIMEYIGQRIEEVNAALSQKEMRTAQGFPTKELGECDDEHAYGGSKCLEAPVFVAAFNYILQSEVLSAVQAAEWEYPEDVRVFWCGQDDNAFEQILPAAEEE